MMRCDATRRDYRSSSRLWQVRVRSAGRWDWRGKKGKRAGEWWWLQQPRAFVLWETVQEIGHKRASFWRVCHSGRGDEARPGLVARGSSSSRRQSATRGGAGAAWGACLLVSCRPWPHQSSPLIWVHQSKRRIHSLITVHHLPHAQPLPRVSSRLYFSSV